MKAKLSPELQTVITKIRKRDKKLADKIQKQIFPLESNPKHPSLRVHKLSANMNNLWSISITMSILMIYMVLDEDIAYFIKIGTHEEVYK